jgi:hypothetical protein
MEIDMIWCSISAWRPGISGFSIPTTLKKSLGHGFGDIQQELVVVASITMCYSRGPRIDGTNGTSTKMASMKNQPHMLVQCGPSIGARQNAKKNIFVAICKSHLKGAKQNNIYIYIWHVTCNMTYEQVQVCIYIFIYYIDYYPRNMVCHFYNPKSCIPNFCVFLSLDGIFDVCYRCQLFRGPYNLIYYRYRLI